jgi:colicin import membrane protein
MKERGLLGILKYDSKAFFFALALHVFILLVVVLSVDFSARPEMQMPQQVETVQAVVVDSAVVQAEMDKIRQAEQRKKNNEQQRLQKLEDKAKHEEQKRKQAEKQRKQEEQKLADLARKREANEKRQQQDAKKLAELEKQKKQLEQERQAEQQRLAALQKKREQEEQERQKAIQAEEDKKRRAAEAEALRERLAEEERQRQQNSARVEKLRAQYVKLIERHITRKWIKPASVSSGMFCEVFVTQNRVGMVLSVKTSECNGDTAFQQSVESAVLRASPLPDPPAPDVFEREVHFTFRP